MEKIPLWKPLSILTVLAVSIYCMLPIGQKLKPGLDLAGGTTLVYQVNIPAGSDAQRDIDDTIAVLSARIDPTGVRNLVWRQLAGNRIEIQMAIASPETAKRREAYLHAADELSQGNLSAQELDAALRAPAAHRAELLNRLAGGSAQKMAALEALAQAEDRLTTVTKPQRETQAELRKAQAKIAALPKDAPDDQRKQMGELAKEIQTQLTALTRNLLEARKLADAARTQVDAANVDPAQLDHIFSLPNELQNDPKDRKAPQSNPRQTALDQLIASHPTRAAEIKKVADAYVGYEEVKGPLDDPNDLIDLLRSSGVLEFRIVAQTGTPSESQFREQLATRGPRSSEGAYIWVPIDDPESFTSKPSQVDALKADPAGFFAGRGMVAQAYGNKIYVLLGNARENSLTHDRDNWQLTAAYPISDERGFPAVAFALDPAGGSLMSSLTGGNINRPMAIVLDGKVMSAPNIQSRISTGGTITGGTSGFSPKELNYLVRTLKAGALKARLSEAPISIQKVSAQFGLDNLSSAVNAAKWTLIIVCAFMASYYFVGGLIADFAVIANIIIILGAMAFTESTFTLPGIAGIILIIGMAVDANVLVFERIREELERKQPIRTAIRLGYSKAMATIIDTHLTTLLTCIILFYVGTADVKGFAVTLGVGLVASFFTAVFASHVLLDIWTRLPFVKTFSMLPLKFPAIHQFFSPSIDWYGKRYFFIGISLVLTIGGAIGIAARGVDFLDIEFRSGTEVGFQVRDGQQPLTFAEVRKRLDKESERLKASLKEQRSALAAKTGEADKAALEQIDEKIQQADYLSGDRASVVTVGQSEGASARAFKIATLATDTKMVTDAIKDAFQDVLSVERPIDYAGMEATEVHPPLVVPIRSLVLGENIDRADVRMEVPPDYMGGVAIVLKDMKPPQTIREIKSRIGSTLLQAEFEGKGYHPYQIISLDAASADAATQSAGGPATQPAAEAGDEPRYASVVLIARDDAVNYAQNPDTLADKGGLADTEWRVVNAAFRRDNSLDSVSNFSSQISGTMQQQAIAAVVLGWMVMLAYIWFRFGDLRFGLGAVLALIHDVITAIGLAALAYYVCDTPIGHALLLQPFRVNLALVAAALTLIGYSVNDTIVVFDRIRENRGKLTILTPGLINDSINQTISRTVLTAGTVLIACFCLYVLGGEAVRGFAFVMLVGALVGCYSSIAVASPLLLVWLKPATATSTGKTGPLATDGAK